MSELYNIYCDESCHLQHDRQTAMALGAVWCPADKAHDSAVRIREIKAEHTRKETFELKWTKVSPGKLQLYRDILDYFFDDDDLRFRALIVPDKNLLDHDKFGQDHDTWYYKMYFHMLQVLLTSNAKFRIYLDIKDTRSADKTRKLHDVLCNNMYDFDRKIVERVQTVRSHEVEQIQLADLLIGIISYAARGLHTSEAKSALVERARTRSKLRLTHSTLLRETKVNIFSWQAQG